MQLCHSLYKSIGPKIETYPSHATIVDTVTLMELGEIEENASLKKQKRGLDGNSFGYGGFLGESKTLSQGQSAPAVPSLSMQSSASAPKHKSGTKGGEFVV